MFNSALSLERYAATSKGRHHCIKTSILDINRECLQGFVALVKQHFDILQEDVRGENEAMQFGASDLLSVVRASQGSRIGFQKTLLVQLESKLGNYCAEVVSNLIQVHSLKGVKVKKEQIGGRGSQVYSRKWSITAPIEVFMQNKHAFRDF